MTNIDLLVLAAKAVGLEHEGYANPACMNYYHPRDGDSGLMMSFDVRNESPLCDDSGVWNPLKNDGDALRLAADLRLLIKPGKHLGDGCSVESQRDGIAGCTAFREDKREQMRYAIVMAAAEIGKALP